jgi:hypothetical protein
MKTLEHCAVQQSDAHRPQHRGATVMIPTVHLNGTAGEDLRDQYSDAAAAVRKAINTLYDAGPNARDYYVQGPDQVFAAQREHEVRVTALRRVLDDLSAIVEGIQDQLDVRDASRRLR